MLWMTDGTLFLKGLEKSCRGPDVRDTFNHLRLHKPTMYKQLYLTLHFVNGGMPKKQLETVTVYTVHQTREHLCLRERNTM